MTHLLFSSPPAVFPELRAGEIHLWLADMTRPDLLEAARAILSPTEIERGFRYRFERDQVWFFVRRFYLRTLLSGYLGQPASTFDIRLSARGKPHLENHPIHFNLSDSDGWCLFAFTRLAPLGVDLEAVRERVDLVGVARRYFSEAEQAEFLRFSEDRQLHSFFHIWTQKEAYIKATGEGLSLPLDSFDVAADPARPGEIRAARGANSTSWAMRTFIPRENFRAALCVETELPFTLRAFQAKS